MKYIVVIFIFNFIISCNSKQRDYELLNDFLVSNDIKLENLSSEPYYLENSLKYLNEKEYLNLNFKINKGEKYTIDTALIKNKLLIPKSKCISKISKPIYSSDSKYITFGIESNCGYEYYLKIYLLSKNKDGKLKIEGTMGRRTAINY